MTVVRFPRQPQLPARARRLDRSETDPPSQFTPLASFVGFSGANGNFDEVETRTLPVQLRSLLDFGDSGTALRKLCPATALSRDTEAVAAQQTPQTTTVNPQKKHRRRVRARATLRPLQTRVHTAVYICV